MSSQERRIPSGVPYAVLWTLFILSLFTNPPLPYTVIGLVVLIPMGFRDARHDGREWALRIKRVQSGGTGVQTGATEAPRRGPLRRNLPYILGFGTGVVLLCFGHSVVHPYLVAAVMAFMSAIFVAGVMSDMDRRSRRTQEI